MADIVTDLAEKSGVSPDQARQGLGAVLAFARESLPADEFAQVSAAVPGSDQLMAAAGPRGVDLRDPAAGPGTPPARG